MVVAPKSKQNRATAFDTHSQSFISQVNIGLIIMLDAMALVTFSLNKIVRSLFHSLVTGGKIYAVQDTSRRTVRLYI